MVGPVREAEPKSRPRRQSLGCFPWCCWLTAAARARMVECPAVPCYTAPPAHAGLLLLPQLPPPTTSLPTPRARGSGEMARYSGPTEPGRGSTRLSRGGHDELHTRQADACPTLYQHGCGHTAPPWEGRRVISSKQTSEHRLEWTINATMWPNPCHPTELLSPCEQGSGRGHSIPTDPGIPKPSNPRTGASGPHYAIASEALSDSGWVDLDRGRNFKSQ